MKALVLSVLIASNIFSLSAIAEAVDSPIDRCKQGLNQLVNADQANKNCTWSTSTCVKTLAPKRKIERAYVVNESTALRLCLGYDGYDLTKSMFVFDHTSLTGFSEAPFIGTNFTPFEITCALQKYTVGSNLLPLLGSCRTK